MATDLEASTNEGETPAARPSLKIVGLHIKGLKSIGSLDLPEDGLGWDGTIPDIIMVGGINGSGKTTLLEFLFTAFTEIASPLGEGPYIGSVVPRNLQAEEAILDFWCNLGQFGEGPIRFLVGNRQFIDRHYTENCFGFEYVSQSRHSGLKVAEVFTLRPLTSSSHQIRNLILQLSQSSAEAIASVVYLPSERRTLINPDTQFQFNGKVAEDFHFVYRWRPPKDGKKPDPLIERIYNVRWNDLSAKEEGRISEANGFEAYSKAFNRFFEGRKRLKWDHGELVVETKSGAIHDLSELSSGEKQVILFMGELLHRWRPGSLILIDEPELHLHESYQTKLWQALLDWQKERGGQVIVSTQSGHLFRISEPGNKVLLSRQSL
jgi:energy-coupling factor transporter ATP-binding protein EcfA2